MEALNEVGGIVSSTLDLDDVLFKIISNAVRFAGCDGGSIMEFDDVAQRFVARTTFPSSPELLADLRSIDIHLDETLVGRAGREGRPVAIPDIERVDRDVHLDLLYADGWRSVLAVPVLHDRRVIGVMVVRRKSPGDFTRDVIEFMATFASQSALAVSNARVYRELEYKRAELEVASGHKSDFLASMSHELRTPLNAIMGFSQVLLDQMFGEVNERQEEYLRDILNSGKHLLELLNEILDLSKVESGRMELEPSVFGVGSVIEQTMALVRERALRHGITLKVDVDPGLDVVESDERRFKQVVLNLLGNAVKFTPDGGHITVTATESRGWLTVAVADDGPGISPEDQDRIFEAFDQGRHGPAREEGTGLGLTLCRRIVELLGGRMWLDSALGVGSTFTVTVPVDVPVARLHGNGHDPSRPVVVVIDDDQRSVDLVSAYLDGQGLRVVGARDGERALNFVRRRKPAAVVLDIVLPGLNGWEVLAQLRGALDTADVPVIVVSALDEKPRGLAAGASDYFVKPVARDHLLGALRAAGVLTN